MRIACTVGTTTWNSVGLARVFLAHYRRLGVDQVLVMDFDSTDGTRDVLTSAEWRGFVRVVPFPGLASLDSSNVLLSVASQAYRPTDWCLFCDPDELLVTPSMSIQAALTGECSGAESISIPRFNMTAPVSVAEHSERGLAHTQALTLRIGRRKVRCIEQDIGRDVLDPPWIFTDISPKIFVRLGTAVAVGEGDHSAVTSKNTIAAAPDGVYLLHYPFRHYAPFRDKIEMARLDFAQNPHLSQAHGWQVRRWIRLADSGNLYNEYLQQFIPDEDVQRLLEDGTLILEESVSRFHSGKDRVDANGPA
jgi:hypothetical protein